MPSQAALPICATSGPSPPPPKQRVVRRGQGGLNSPRARCWLEHSRILLILHEKSNMGSESAPLRAGLVTATCRFRRHPK